MNGLRFPNNSETLQYKNDGGSWADFSSGGGGGGGGGGGDASTIHQILLQNNK